MIIALLILPILIGFAALAVEGGLWYADRHDLRLMADSAAIAAAWARKEDSNELSGATAAATELGYDEDTDDLVVNSPPTLGAYAGSADAIEVVITRTRPLLLSTLFLPEDSIDISMRAVANLTGGTLGDACVLALDATASGAITVSGNGSVSLSGCGVMANSSSASAVSVGGSGELSADYLAAVGGYSQGGSSTITVPTMATGNDAVADPFATLAPPWVPTAADCWEDGDAFTTGGSGTTASPPAGSVFCDGMTVKNTMVLNEGTYYITGGSLYFTANANITSTGPVTFVLLDDATIDIRGGATINLSAPTDAANPYQGLVFFSTSTNTDTIKINGGSTMNLSGAMYFRNQDVEFRGNNSVAGGCLRVIAQTVDFGGDSGMGSDCSAYGLPPMAPNGTDPLLVE